MTTTINGRTPKEIKMGLEHCSKTGLATCEGCPYNNAGCYEEQHHIDALAYIQQLERERDAAVEAVEKLAYNADRSIACEFCEFRDYQCVVCEFKWRGVEVDQ